MRNYGLTFEEIKKEDYVLGGFSRMPKEALQEDGDWTNHLPEKEFQNLNAIEPYACVAFTVLNCSEILIKRKYGEDTNYSDRFLAAISGTKEGGNSPQRVCEFLRKVGVVPQEVWPFNKSIDTFGKFYEDIPPKLYELAKEFNERWVFKHEYVPTNHKAISEAITLSPLLVSAAAWFKRNGKYYRPEGLSDSHATTMFYNREGEFRRVFDTYDSPHIKDLEWESIPMVVKRFHIEKRTTKRCTFWQRITSRC